MEIPTFTGLWIPVEILDLFDNDTINRSELFLLGRIHAFSGNKNKNGNRECFASNEFLAEQVKLKVRMVQTMIKHLIEIGLLLSHSDSDRRVLRVSYIPTIIETQKNASGDDETQKNAPRNAIKCVGAIHTINNSSLITVGNESPTKKSKKPIHKRWIKFATQLAGAIQTVRKINCTTKVSSWAKSFEQLKRIEGIPPTRIREVLNWYCDQLPKEPKYLPVAHSGSAFREKFSRIEDQMEKDSPSKSESSTPVTEYTPHQKEKADNLIESFRMAGQNLNESEIPSFVFCLYDWMKEFHAMTEKIVMEQEYEIFRDNIRSDLRGIQYEIVGDYFHWILNQVKTWDGWGGGLNQFRPRKKHFLRFMRIFDKKHGSRTDKLWKEFIYAEA